MDDEDIKYCKRCHRKLKGEKSRQLGYGVICFNKIKNKKSIYLFEIEEDKCSDIINSIEI